MKLNKRLVSATVLFITSAFLFGACKINSIGGAQKRADRNNSSVIASIGGMDDGDDKLTGIGYFLVCGEKNDKKVQGTMETKGGKDQVTFPGKDIKDGDSCAMEITATVPDAEKDSYIWYSTPTPIVGLFYSSNKDVVKNRALSLKLFKLYAKRTPDAKFTALIGVKFTLKQGESMPEIKNLSANLDCGEFKPDPSNNFAPKQQTSDEGTFSFILSVDKAQNTKCSKITVAVENTAKFEGELVAVEFKTPKKDDIVRFDGPFALKAIQSGDITVITEGDNCLKFDAEKHQCLDVRSVKLPREKNYWFAMIEGKDEANNAVSYVVSNKDLQLDPMTKDVAIDALKADLEKAPAEQKFSWYQGSVETTILNSTLDDNLKSGLATSIPASDLVKKAKLLNISKLWLHGFSEITADALDKYESAYWLAMVVASKNGAQVGEFVVTGFNPHFYSPHAPGGTLQSPIYFDWAKVKENMGSTIGPYRLYTIKGNGLAKQECQADKAYYLDGTSEKNDETIYPEDAKLDACEVLTIGSGDFNEWQITQTLYRWGWYVAK